MISQKHQKSIILASLSRSLIDVNFNPKGGSPLERLQLQANDELTAFEDDDDERKFALHVSDWDNFLPLLLLLLLLLLLICGSLGMGHLYGGLASATSKVKCVTPRDTNVFGIKG